MKRYTDAYVAGLLPWPAPNMNKYTRGRVVLVVGSRNYPGAAILASLASQRAGAGYTEVYVEDHIVSQVQSAQPSFVVHPWSRLDEKKLQASTAHHPCAYVVGSGFDAKDPYITSMAYRILKHAQAPVVVDGGALHLLASRRFRDLCEARYAGGQSTILTPHGGEAASLAKVFDIPTEDPEDLALMLSQAYGALVVLKGPNTYITDGEGLYLMNKGTAALAKAGTGDILAGVFGGLLAQGVDPIDACVLGSTLHAHAGALAAEDYSEICVTPEDILRYIPDAVFALKWMAESASQ